MTSDSASLAVRYGRWLFKHRNKVFTVFMLVLLLGLPPVTFAHDVALDRWLDVFGIAIAAGGQALRAAVIGLEYIKRGGVNKQPHADKLVTGGMFAHCRNPLYVGNLLILAGLFVIHNHPLVYLLGGLFYLGAYHAIVAAEEDYLRNKFGAEFDAYCRDVPRWTVRMQGLGATMASMEMNWKRMVQKDYGTAYFWMAGAALLLTVERLRADSTGYVGVGTMAPLAALAALTAVFFVVWRLKRARYFQTSNG
ncbi:MAG: isoprenylcysteine carboxylmethyltransferase family protein [Proteobacteria bacterium]|nr:isoprenylcysteine carboxylmethyltransferase family protein [Pseudomonadota bacterium]